MAEQTKRKIAVVTGTRADYGLLLPVMRAIQSEPQFQLQLIVTGMHLSPEYGLTYKVIEADGFRIDEKVEMLLSSDTPSATVKAMGIANIGFADALERLQPDLMMLLGDRFELLAAAQAALVLKIPIAHLVGGDTTEGAFDEAIRHSITKMAHLHFVTNSVSARRVRQMGENPQHVYEVGSPGIDALKQVKLLDREQLARKLPFEFRKRNLLITFHPVTLEQGPSTAHFQELLTALQQIGTDTGLIFTKPNADPEGRKLITMIDDFVASHSNAAAFTSLGQLYYSTISAVDAVVGNSSSGLYEVPSFTKPTVNIGDRQKGRLQAQSVINCEPVATAITNAIDTAFAKDCSATVNPYGDGATSPRIIEKLKAIPDWGALLKKHFFDYS